MKIYVKTNKATTNIFGLHTQPRKTTRYTNILKLVWGGGRGGGGGGEGRKKSRFLFKTLEQKQKKSYSGKKMLRTLLDNVSGISNYHPLPPVGPSLDHPSQQG